MLRGLLWLFVVIVAIAGAFSLGAQFAHADEVINFQPNSFTDWDNLGTAGHEMYAETFTPSANSDAVQSISFGFFKVGSPTDDLVVSIYTDSGGVPGASLGSASISGSTITGGSSPSACANYSFVDISAILNSGTPYWVVFSRSGSLNSTNRYAICMSSSGSVYDYHSGAWQFYYAAYESGSFSLHASGGGGGGSVGGSLLQWVISFMAFLLVFLVLIRFSKSTEKFLAAMGPSKVLKRIFGVSLRSKYRKWYE